jgi:hypothetical protein
MKEFVLHLNDFFKRADFDWCVCGGFAIDLFAGHSTRPHEDLDIAVFWQDKKRVISFMMDAKWRVFEAMGGGVICEILDTAAFSRDKRNLFCFTSDNCSCHLASVGTDMYQFRLDSREQSTLDYIEFLFNDQDDENLIYSQNHSILRSLRQAVQMRNEIPFLAPEIVLLYKSIYINYLEKEDEYSLRLVSNAVNDFNLLLPLLDRERKDWLNKVLRTVYPNGHAWIRRLEKSF